MNKLIVEEKEEYVKFNKICSKKSLIEDKIEKNRQSQVKLLASSPSIPKELLSD